MSTTNAVTGPWYYPWPYQQPEWTPLQPPPSPRVLPVNLPISSFGVTIAILKGDGELEIKTDQADPRLEKK